MKQSIRARLEALESQLAKMVAVDVEIKDKDTGEVLKETKANGLRHSIIVVRAEF